MKLCPNCNEEIMDDNSKFCPKCGSELDNINNTQNELKKDNINNLVDNASNTLNKVVNQVKIEKNYIKYKLDNEDKSQVKSDEFIISEKIVNTIENINKDKESVKKTKIELEDDKNKN